MPLTAGTKLGPYEILAPLGEGGMGEVYRAHDSRLHRDVAIKTLPAAFADDAERMARFQREAQVLAALNHPHIAAIYGIEGPAIVMELVEGKNLAGPVPVNEAIAIAREIADALDAAHQKNIIHRDLKPANIRITPEGCVKVLDFGLAKAFDTGAAGGDPVNSPTITMDSTRAGVILGTAAYMSPEQARGKVVDKRADIWSFGAVFYELLTGVRAFEGDTVSDTLAAVLKTDPDWSRLPAGTPAGVRRLLERSLERDPNKRLRDIGDAWAGVDAPADSPPPRANPRWHSWTTAALALVAAAAVCGWLWERWRVPQAPLLTVTRSAMIAGKYAGYPALSHDGTRLVYTVASGATQLALRMMDQLEGKPIAGTERAYFPEFSPDGQWIAYLALPAPFKLKKIPVTGGTSITLCDASLGHVSWGVDDTIVFSSQNGLMQVSAAGGTPRRLTTVSTKDGELQHMYPQFLPGGKAIVFSVRTAESLRVAVLDLKTGAYRVVLPGGYAARYAPTGHLVYVRANTLYAVPFDLKRLAVTGAETPVVEGASGDYAFSDSSLLVFAEDAGEDDASTLEWVDRKGAAEPLAEPPHRWGEYPFKISPDGKLVAGPILAPSSPSGPAHSDIWIYDVQRRTLARLTFEGVNDSPVWTPDGKWVTYVSSRDGKYGIYRVAADKSGPPELLLATGHARPLSWTPDGAHLFYALYGGAKSQMLVFSPGSGRDAKPWPLQTSFHESEAQVSPDGKWVAYYSNESGKYEIYVSPFPGPGGKSQISAHGGKYPTWSRTGRELFYEEPVTNQLMAVDVQAGPVFRAGQPQALFKLVYASAYDVMPDGQRFLVERRPERSLNTTFVLVTNWFDDLRRRAPLKK